MSYLHCHGCDWGQDDFWSLTYSPFHSSSWTHWVKEFEEIAFNGKLDDPIKERYDTKGLGLPEATTYREFFALEMERKASIIKDMAVPTWEDWIKIRDSFKCPRCGSKNWDID